MKALADSVSGEGPLPDSETPIFQLCPHMVGRLERAHWIPFMRALRPLMRRPPSWLNHLHRPHLLIPSNWELGFNIWIWEWCKPQSVAFFYPQFQSAHLLSFFCEVYFICTLTLSCPSPATQADAYNLKDSRSFLTDLPAFALSAW